MVSFIHLWKWPKQLICSASNSYEIKHTPLHNQKVGVWCVIPQNQIISPVFFSDTINMEHYCEVILYPFIGHLNGTKLPTAISNRMVLLHTQLMFPWYILGQENFKGHLATMVAQSYTPSLLSVGSKEGNILWIQWSLSLRWWKILQILSGIPFWLNFCYYLCKQGKTCRWMSTSTQGPWPAFWCNLSIRNVFVLMCRDCLNTLIIFGMCAMDLWCLTWTPNKSSDVCRLTRAHSCCKPCSKEVAIAISPQVISAPNSLQIRRNGRFPTVVNGDRYNFPFQLTYWQIHYEQTIIGYW